MFFGITDQLNAKVVLNTHCAMEDVENVLMCFLIISVAEILSSKQNRYLFKIFMRTFGKRVVSMHDSKLAKLPNKNLPSCRLRDWLRYQSQRPLLRKLSPPLRKML